MSIEINKEIVNEILSDLRHRTELCEFLNQVIDEEIAKGDDMDDVLVSECVDAIMELDSGNFEQVIEKLGKSKNIVKLAHRKSFAKNNMTRSVAAAIALILLTSGVTLQTNPALAQKAKDFFNQIIDVITMSDEETDEDSDVTQIYLTYDEPPVITSEDVNDLDLSGITVHAVHKDGSESIVKIDDCKVSVNRISDEEDGAYMLNVSYKGVSSAIICYTEE